MKLLVVADIDDYHWKHGKGKADVLLSCGDVIDQVILEAANAYACTRIFAVKGNHDIKAAFVEPIVDLHLCLYEYNGINFGGLNGSWRYKPRGHFLYDQQEVQEYLATFPPVDIFLSHNSPRTIDDKEDEVHYGFTGLNAYIQRVKPTLLIHGHQHLDRETWIEKMRVIAVYGHKLVDV